jgi:predicted dehydrogenase
MKKVAVFGTAHPHIYALAATAAALEEVEMVGVYEPDAGNRQEAEKRLGINATDDLDAILGLQPHLVLIGALPAQRAELAQQAMARGATVLMDKPIALTHAALEQLIAAQEKADRPAIVYFPYRGDPMVLAAKAALDKGVIGKLVRIFSSGPHQLHADNRPDWHWTRDGNGGAMIDIGAHHADICCFFADQSPCWISSLHVNASQGEHKTFQDFAQAQIRFPNGVLGHLEVDWLNPESMEYFGDTRLWMQGTKGKIEIRIGDVVEARIWTHQEADKPLDTSGIQSLEEWDAQLIGDLINDRPCVIPQADVWRGSRVTLHAFDSASRNGQPVELPG